MAQAAAPYNNYQYQQQYPPPPQGTHTAHGSFSQPPPGAGRAPNPHLSSMYEINPMAGLPKLLRTFQDQTHLLAPLDTTIPLTRLILEAHAIIRDSSTTSLHLMEPTQWMVEMEILNIVPVRLRCRHAAANPCCSSPWAATGAFKRGSFFNEQRSGERSTPCTTGSREGSNG